MKLITGVDPNLIFLGSGGSRNGVSTILMIQVILVYISCIEQKKQIMIWPALISVFFSAWAGGRGGLLVNTLLVFGILIINFFNNRKYFRQTIKLMTIFTIIFCLINLLDNTIFETILYRLSTQGLEDTARALLRNEYINLASNNFKNLIFGVNIKHNAIFSSFGYNLHNSYLRLHANFGIVGLLIVAIFLRISSDELALFGFIDPIIWFLLLYKNKIIKGETL